MGSIALPALDVKAPQQEDLLQKFAQLNQIKASQQAQAQNAAEAPLRMQALNQGVQSGQMDIDQKQQAVKNQQAITSAYKAWDGRDYADLAHLAVQNGATGDTAQTILQHGLEIRKSASAIAASDAKTGADNATTLGKQLDQAAGALQGVLSAPPEQMGQALITTAQQLAAQKRPDGSPLLDASHLQMAEQLAQKGPEAITSAIPTFAKSLTAFSAQLDAAAKQAQTAKENADAAAKQAEADFYKNGGNGAPGVPVEAVQQADWLKKNPGKGPSDFLAWKAKQAPLAQLAVINATGEGKPAADVARQFGMSPASFDQTAEKYATTGQLPPIGRSGGGMALNKAIMNRAAELHPDGSLAANSAEYKANSESLKKLQANFDTVSAFENTANKNIEMLKGLAQKVPDLGSRFANIPVRMLSGSMIGGDNMAAFKTALAPVQTEAAKILNSANLSGSLSDSSRHELQEIVDGNMPYSALVSSLGVLQQDFKNRHEAYQDQIADIQKRLGGQKSGTSGGGTGLGVKLSDAMALPQNKGKTKEQVMQDIKSHGHTVIE